MEEVRLPLSQEEIVHKIILNGHRMAVKTNYDEESARVQLVDGEDSFVDILNVPLLLFFEFRSNQMIRTSKDVWSIELKGEAAKGADFIILKLDKSQVINIAACSKYLANNAFCDSILSCGHYTLYVNKNTLGEKSTYFKALFNGDFKEKDQKTITIQFIDGEVVHSVVLISCDERYRITDANVELIMNAADFFGMEFLMNKCNDHLTMNSKMSEFRRLKMLDKYNQHNSIDELTEAIKSKMSIRENDEFDELSDVSQLKILREAVKELKTIGLGST